MIPAEDARASGMDVRAMMITRAVIAKREKAAREIFLFPRSSMVIARAARRKIYLSLSFEKHAAADYFSSLYFKSRMAIGPLLCVLKEPGLLVLPRYEEAERENEAYEGGSS